VPLKYQEKISVIASTKTKEIKIKIKGIEQCSESKSF